MVKYRPEYDMELIGRNLKRLREKNKLSVEEVREYLCLGSVQAVYKYEKGKSYPQADTLIALLQLYHAGIDDIVGNHEEDEMSSSVVLPHSRASADDKQKVTSISKSQKLCA